MSRFPFIDDIASLFARCRLAAGRLLAAREAMVTATAGELLAGGRPEHLATDDLNTGKLTKLLLWQAENILDEYRNRPLTGRGVRVRQGLGWALAHESTDAVSGDFCYSFARRLRHAAPGTV